MNRLVYAEVAAAIAAANDSVARASAGELVASYYAVEPAIETTRQRIAILKQALQSALAREGK